MCFDDLHYGAALRKQDLTISSHCYTVFLCPVIVTLDHRYICVRRCLCDVEADVHDYRHCCLVDHVDKCSVAPAKVCRMWQDDHAVHVTTRGGGRR